MCWIQEFAKVCCLEQMPCLKYQETETLTTSLLIYILLISLHLSFLAFILPIAITKKFHWDSNNPKIALKMTNS